MQTRGGSSASGVAPLAEGPALIESAARRQLPQGLQRLALARMRTLCTIVAVGLLGIAAGAHATSHRIVLIGGAAATLTLRAASARSWLRCESWLGLGRVHVVAVALLVSTVQHAEGRWPGALSGQFPASAVLFVLFGALVPLRPSQILATGLVGAAMAPLSLYLVVPRANLLRETQLLLETLPAFVGAILGYLCSRHVYGLTQNISQARKIGSYRLVSRIGTGGMGEVWKAKHNLLVRPAAIKLVRPRVLMTHGVEESRRLLRLFEREAQTTARLTSPHTIQVYDYGVTEDGTFFYVMELLAGFDLQTLVERFGPQPPERVSHLIRQATLSLAEAHAHGLVHRDLKPANIFSCRYGGDFDFVKILDFGLVMDRRPTAEELERPGLVGTPAVMAPEMVRFNAPVDQRADVYALGCVAYWLLTGRRAFEAQSRADMLVMHAHQKPIPPSRQAPRPLPEGLDSLVMRCLEKNPNRRPQSALELRQELTRLDLIGWGRERRRDWWRRCMSQAAHEDSTGSG